MNIVEQFKKGWKTSEFWVSLVPILAAPVAFLTGYEFDTEGAIALITSLFGAVGYAANRTWLKRKRIDAVVSSTPPEA